VLARSRLPPALVVLLCLAGCGPPKAEKPGHYTLKPTAACLKRSGLKVAQGPKAVDFISATAPAGAFRSARDGKGFTVAFGNTEEDAIILVKGYERVAKPKAKKRLHSLLDREGNAVVYWATEPTAAQSEAVRSCLQ
jgi:hypothetical protein